MTTEHNTLAECRFISMLGRGANGSTAKLPNRSELLIGYRNGLLARTNWRGLDRVKVLSHLQAEIDRECGK